ncbi:MAG: formate dehydrogenase accessory protein FdhE [Burkholderiaceae bacterium]|jgi:FdhE protein|nr:formate dehydrogenase accessory protein FdhE [Burkholderiaceae bacterium]
MTAPAPPRPPSPDEIALRAGLDFPRLLAPQPSALFAERALRLRELAAGHALHDYLMLMALICEAQHALAQDFPAVPLPTSEQADAAARAGRPLLDATCWPRDGAWRGAWRRIVARVLEKLPAADPDSPARAHLHAIAAWDDDALEQQAGRLIAGIPLGLDMAAAPFVAAGLQLYWTILAARTAAALGDPFGHRQGERTARCPCCGSLPVASVVRGGAPEGYRYLHCSLCNSQWHVVRVKCTHCGSTSGIGYQALQALADAKPQPGQRPAIQAETCDACQHYLKILHQQQAPHLDPVADDLASLTLDLLVADAGYVRHGVNPFLLFGDDGGAAGAPR